MISKRLRFQLVAECAPPSARGLWLHCILRGHPDGQVKRPGAALPPACYRFWTRTKTADAIV